MTYIEDIEDREIDFTEPREFSELISAPFNFIIKNFKGLMAPLVRYAFPVIIIGLVFLSLFVNYILKFSELATYNFTYNFIYIGVGYLLILAGGILSVSLIYSYISLYALHGRDNFDISEVKQLGFSSFFRILIVNIISIIIISIGLILFIIPGIYFSIALQYANFIVVHEKAGPFEAISRSFELISGNWWKTFGLMFILQFIVAIVIYIVYIPAIAAIMFVAMNGLDQSIIVGILVTTMLLVAVLGIIASFIPMLALTFLYFNIIEEKESPGLINKINNINKEEENKEENKEDYNRFKRF